MPIQIPKPADICKVIAKAQTNDTTDLPSGFSYTYNPEGKLIVIYHGQIFGEPFDLGKRFHQDRGLYLEDNPSPPSIFTRR